MNVGRAALASVVACALLACDGLGSAFDDTDVALGSAIASNRTDGCLGDGCVAIAPDALALDEDNPTRCPLRKGSPAEVVWSQPYSWDAVTNEPIVHEDCGALSPCVLDGGALRIAAADDGTLWLAATVGPVSGLNLLERPAAGVWLAHYASDGTQLSGELMDYERLEIGDLLRYEVSIAAAARGGVLLGVFMELATEGFPKPQRLRWVRGYGSDGAPIGPGVERTFTEAVYGAPSFANAGDSAVALLDGLRITLYEDWTPRWERRLYPYMDQIFSDGRALWTFSMGMAGELHQYTGEGAPAWIRTFPRPLQNVKLAIDARGAMLRSAIPLTPFGQPPTASDGAILHKISAAGDSQWCIELQAELPQAVDVNTSGPALTIDGTGTSWLLGPGYSEVDLSAQPEPTTLRNVSLIYEIDADGGGCIAHEVAHKPSVPPGFNDIAAATGGGLYFVSFDAFGLMRF